LAVPLRVFPVCDLIYRVGMELTQPVRIAVMNDYEVVVIGLRAMLAEFADRVQVVELDCQLPVASDIDVLLYDSYSRERITGPVLETLRNTRAPFVMYTWNLGAEIVRECLDQGAAGCLSKTLPAAELVEAIEKVHGGSVVIHPDPGPDALPRTGDWPGRDAGLTARESEILALITLGLTNLEIAERAYLSPNTVKSFIRSAYRKIGVQRRSQAVVWATRHGFLPDVARTVVEPPLQLAR
jgi:NarL family two-component system response regulator LiaR